MFCQLHFACYLIRNSVASPLFLPKLAAVLIRKSIFKSSKLVEELIRNSIALLQGQCCQLLAPDNKTLAAVLLENSSRLPVKQLLFLSGNGVASSLYLMELSAVLIRISVASPLFLIKLAAEMIQLAPWPFLSPSHPAFFKNVYRCIGQ